MRTYTIGQLTITYPDVMIYDGDNNVVSVTAEGSDATVVGATIDGDQAIYSSESEYCCIEIGSLLKKGGHYGSVTVTIYASRSNPAYSTPYDVTFFFCHGRTVPSRYHGSPRRVILPASAENVEIPVMGAGGITLGGNTQIISEACIAEVSLAGLGEQETAQVEVHYRAKRALGNFETAEDTQEADFELEIVRCLRSGEVFVGWYDIDGCKRYAVGRVLSRRSASDSISYTPGMSIVRHEPNAIAANANEVLELGISGVDSALRLGELAWSDEVWLLNEGTGETIPVILDGDITTDERRTGDMILKLKTLI